MAIGRSQEALPAHHGNSAGHMGGFRIRLDILSDEHARSHWVDHRHHALSSLGPNRYSHDGVHRLRIRCQRKVVPLLLHIDNLSHAFLWYLGGYAGSPGGSAFADPVDGGHGARECFFPLLWVLVLAVVLLRAERNTTGDKGAQKS